LTIKKHVQDLAEYRQYNTSPGRDMLFTKCKREEVDCTTDTLNGLGTGSALVAAGCFYYGVAPCVLVAGGASTAFGIIGTGVTAFRNDADLKDVAVSGSTTIIGAKSHPYFSPIVSLYQWWLDRSSE